MDKLPVVGAEAFKGGGENWAEGGQITGRAVGGNGEHRAKLTH